MRPLSIVLLLLVSGACCRDCAADRVPLVDLSASAQRFTDANFRVQLLLSGAIANGDGQGRDLELTVDVVDGEPGKGFGHARQWNTTQHEAKALPGLRIVDGVLKGEIDVVLQPDQWVPSDKQPVPLRVAIEATVTRLFEEGERPFSAASWEHPQKRRGVLAACSGSYTVTCAQWSAPVQGTLSGELRLPIAPQRWTVGLYADDAVQMGFDLGAQRRNWTHMACSRLDLPAVRDLSDFGGLRLTILTDTPRQDAVIAVWLKERDGSWYYVTDACPLAAAQNIALIAWEDFEEAEWVSPDGGASHMDEDFVLDREQIEAIAIGVVNPFGIGPVQWSVAAIDLLPGAPAPGGVEVAVSGRTLAINGHEYIPPGVFGAYYPDLPQQYRPGCLRHLKTVPTGGVSDPDGHVLAYGGDLVDAPALLAEIRAGGAALQPLADLLARHAGKLDKTAEKYAGPLPEDAKKRAKAIDEIRKAVARVLDALVDGEALLGVAPFTTDADRAEAAEAERRLAHRPAATRQRVLNRRLLDRFLGERVRPMMGWGAYEAFIIDCQGDRTQTATFLNNDNWAGYLADCGRGLAKGSAATGYRIVSEFWNEPYLDWQKGKNFSTKLFREDLAGEGKPVIVRRKDGNTDDVIPHFAWHKNGEGWKVVDESAFTYWSGKGNEYIYNRMFEVYGKAVKEADPAVEVIAGWGMKWHEDHWAAWELLFKPTIDKNIQWFDGLHEHHYQGDTSAQIGAYEVMVAYCQTEHDKWIHGSCTETTDLIDAPAVGALNTPEKVEAANEYRIGSYNLRDILGLLAHCPDKVRARTVFENDESPLGTRMCFGTLRDLRGRLVQAHSSDPGVWVSAAIDGSDPATPRPQGGQALVVAVWNDHREGRTISIDLAAPTGCSFAGPAVVEKPWFDLPTMSERFVTEELAVAGTSCKVAVSVPGRAVWKISIPLAGPVPEAAEVVRTQHFARGILQTVPVGKQVQAAVAIPTERLQAADTARLRLVLEALSEGEGQVTVNGTAFVLPKVAVRDNGNRLVEIDLPRDLVRENNDLVFSVTGTHHQGYRVDMASIVVE